MSIHLDKPDIIKKKLFLGLYRKKLAQPVKRKWLSRIRKIIKSFIESSNLTYLYFFASIINSQFSYTNYR